MRILFFNYEFPPIGGGGANANEHLFREFAEVPELTIDCVTSAWGNRDEEIAFAPNIRLHRLAVGKRERHFWREGEILRYLWRAHGKAEELMKLHRYDLCHAFFGFPSGLPAWWRRRHLPYLISLRGSDVPGFNPRFKWHYPLLKPLFRRIWRDARFVVANSAGLKALSGEFAPTLPMEIIPNGVDSQAFSPAESPQYHAPRLLCVSRLIERKGVRHLLEAMPAVLECLPEAELTLVGDGDLADALKRRCAESGIAEKVIFAGYVPHEALPEFYRRAALFVLPSYYEGMSNTVLEAMACGLPILAGGEGGREELLRDNALTVPFGDPRCLAERMIELLRNPARLAAMGRRSRAIAGEFSWAAVAERYLELYRTMQASPTRED